MTTFSSSGMGDWGSSWSKRGYSGCGNVAELLDSSVGHPAVVCGSAYTVFEELEIIRYTYGIDLIIFGVNDVGMFLPRMDHWVSLHSDQFHEWKAVRWLHRPGDESVYYHGVDKRHEVSYAWELLTPIFALSGYFAMQIAWLMGCNPIILAGCPGDNTRKFYEAERSPDFGYGSGISASDNGIRTQLVNEMNRLPEFKAVVKSMSGWTQNYFGGVQ